MCSQIQRTASENVSFQVLPQAFNSKPFSCRLSCMFRVVSLLKDEPLHPALGLSAASNRFPSSVFLYLTQSTLTSFLISAQESLHHDGSTMLAQDFISQSQIEEV